jgi:hypothetical protein
MLLNNDIFSIRINAHSFYPTRLHFDIPEAIQFEVIEYNVEGRKTDYRDRFYGIIRPDLEWGFEKIK